MISGSSDEKTPNERNISFIVKSTFQTKIWLLKDLFKVAFVFGSIFCRLRHFEIEAKILRASELQTDCRRDGRTDGKGEL